MYDVEKVISSRIKRDTAYLNSKLKPAVANRIELEIMTLEAAPRTEKALIERIKKVKSRIEIERHGDFDTLFLDRLYAERDALEWLLTVVRLKDSYHSEDGMI